MDNKQFMKMFNAIKESAKRYPNCKIANCDCDSKNGKRVQDCVCLCHIEDMKKTGEFPSG